MDEAITLPAGFRAAGYACGIKSDPRKLDLALFVSDVPCASAGVFTQNRVCGAPVKVSRSCLPRGTGRAVVINSGNSNACTGERGIEDARWMTAETARHLSCPQDDVFVCSTGVIGHFLPREKLAAGIPVVVEQLAETPESFAAAAQGMMTTDTFHKLAARDVPIAGATCRVRGVSKGAAMIGPNMATMLAVVLTDAPLDTETADRMLRHAVDRSFNCISVEGHTSTSDSVILLANGAGCPGVECAALIPADLERLQTAIDGVCTDLAQLIIRDAEGAEHFVTIDVRGAKTPSEAVQIAKTVADGPLVKTAVTGNDPNWGRIVSAVGYSGVEVTEEEISLSINGTPIYERGCPVEFDAAAVSAAMRTGEVHLELTFTRGTADTRFWTSDLTSEYVRLNSEYTT